MSACTQGSPRVLPQTWSGPLTFFQNKKKTHSVNDGGDLQSKILAIMADNMVLWNLLCN